jgi:hypothetical protein
MCICAFRIQCFELILLKLFKIQNNCKQFTVHVNIHLSLQTSVCMNMSPSCWGSYPCVVGRCLYLGGWPNSESSTVAAYKHGPGYGDSRFLRNIGILPDYTASHSRRQSSMSLDSITQIFNEKYKSWSSSLCRFLQYPVTCSLLGPNSPVRTNKITALAPF